MTRTTRDERVLRKCEVKCREAQMKEEKAGGGLILPVVTYHSWETLVNAINCRGRADMMKRILSCVRVWKVDLRGQLHATTLNLPLRVLLLISILQVRWHSSSVHGMGPIWEAFSLRFVVLYQTSGGTQGVITNFSRAPSITCSGIKMIYSRNGAKLERAWSLKRRYSEDDEIMYDDLLPLVR